MIIREVTEAAESSLLCPYASRSQASRGRQVAEPACPVRTIFQVDRDRILHSKAFRRLKYKTQVFLAPEGDHYRTRLTHTLEVSQVARTMARALRLNEDLTEAIALGHDLGHTPFGHAGERVLAELLPRGFHHVNQSLRVVEVLEKMAPASTSPGKCATAFCVIRRAAVPCLARVPRSSRQLSKDSWCGFPTSLPMSTMTSMMPSAGA